MRNLNRDNEFHLFREPPPHRVEEYGVWHNVLPQFLLANLVVLESLSRLYWRFR